MGTGISSRRNQSLMCWRCRHDKRKCTPLDRDWDVKKQKCERCSRLRYECGPPERAPRRSRKRSPAASVALDRDQRRDTYVGFDLTSSVAQLGDLTTRPTSPCQSQTVGVTPETVLDPSVTQDFDLVRAGRLSCSKFDDVLTHLGDLFATRELLRWDLVLCDQVGEWLGSPRNLVMVKEAVQGMINAVQEEFEERVKKTRYNLVRNRELATDQTMLQLYLIAYKFVNPPPSVISDGRDYSTGEQSSLQQLGHTLHQNTLAYSDAEYICGAVWDQSQCDHQPSKTFLNWIAKCFHNASTAVACILSEIVPRKYEHRELFCGRSTGVEPTTDKVPGYPVEHLAVMYGSPLLSLELWGKPVMKLGQLDCLRRTSLHTAVYAGKIHELRCIVEHDSITAKKTDTDIFGLTPLMIAACRNDVKIATLLLKYGADSTVRDSAGRNALALAARNGSHSMVKLLQCHGHISDSLPLGLGEPCEAKNRRRTMRTDSLISHSIKHESPIGSGLLPDRPDLDAVRQRDMQDVNRKSGNSAVYKFDWFSTTSVCDGTCPFDSGSSCSKAGEEAGRTVATTNLTKDSRSRDYLEATGLLRRLPESCKYTILQQIELTLEQDPAVSHADLPNHLSRLSDYLGIIPAEPFQTDYFNSVSLLSPENGLEDFTNASDFLQNDNEECTFWEPWYGMDSMFSQCSDTPYGTISISAME